MSKFTTSDDDLQRSLGIHRVLEPRGALPQPAWKLDNTPIRQTGETLVDVHALHIDSASFAQIAGVCQRDEQQMREHIRDIVARRGKMHNPVTGSGGVLIGTALELDERFAAMHGLAIGDTVVSLTSLSWLPLYLESIETIYMERAEVEVHGKAIFFRSNPLAKLPRDLPQSVVVAALDVAGAPSRVFEMVQPGQRVTVIGAGGTAGLLALCALRKRMGSQGEIIAVEYHAGRP
jgi:L-erythro-3,5-diaminohexanoate dehydrogenase